MVLSVSGISQNTLDFKSIKNVIDKCRELKDLILHDTSLSDESIGREPVTVWTRSGYVRAMLV